MAQLPQNKRGYIRGVVGAVVTRVNSDGTPDGGATPYGVKTIQSIPYDAEVVAGERANHRGGDRLLASVKDPDTVVGITLTMKDARFDAHAIETIIGGTLIEVAEASDTRVVGWEPPTIEEQQNPVYFKLEVYARSYASRSGIEAFLKYTFAFCRATYRGENLEDGAWVIQDLAIEAAENPSDTGGIYRKEFVNALPAELQ